MAAALETIGLSKRYGRRQAVAGLDLRVPEGCIFGFLGPNGAGKSTTIRMTMGLVRPSAGAVRIFGHLVGRNGPPAEARVGALVESPALADYLSGRRNLEMLAALSGGAEAGRIDQVLELVGLTARQHDRVRTYSHGMRQRLGLAQALVPRPRFLILDEPALGLDPEGLAEMRRLLLYLRDEEHMTVFLSSHLLHEVEHTCDEVAVIVQGQLLVQGRVAELLRARSGRLVVRVDNAPRAATVARGVAGVQSVAAADGQLLVDVAPQHVADLNVALVQAGLRVTELTRERPTLEQAYLEWMARDEAAP